jgi:DNA-binding phage protein
MNKTITIDIPHDHRHDVFLQVIDMLYDYTDVGLKEIADQAKCHWTTLYNWKAGKTGTPQLNKIAAVAAVLGYELRLHRTSRKPVLRRVK